MKKIKNLLLMFTLVMAVASCDSDDDTGFDNELLGTWEVSESEEGKEIGITAKFNSNETGEIATILSFGGQVMSNETMDFTWSTEGNKLTMVIEGDTEISTYSVSGNNLTITDSDGDSFVLTKV